MAKNYFRALPNIVFHVRHRCGVSIHMMYNRIPAMNLARSEGLEVYEIDRTKGTAVRLS